MTWFKVCDKFHSHPKSLMAGNDALGLWVRMGSWSSDQLTDGLIPRHVVRLFDPQLELARALVDAGLWSETDGGEFLFHDWNDANPTAKEVASLRKKRAFAGRKGAKQKHSKCQASAKQVLGGCQSNVLANLCPDPDPDPPPIVPPQTLASAGGGEPKAKPKRKQPLGPMPSDWQPDETRRQLAHSLGLDLAAEADNFRDWTASKDQRYADWQRAFSSHLRRRKDRGGVPAGNAQLVEPDAWVKLYERKLAEDAEPEREAS